VGVESIFIRIQGVSGWPAVYQGNPGPTPLA
jgi:hypothetical protein